MARSKKASNDTRKFNDVFWHTTCQILTNDVTPSTVTCSTDDPISSTSSMPNSTQNGLQMPVATLDLIRLLCNRYCSKAEKRDVRVQLETTVQRYERFLQEANVVELAFMTWNHSRRATHSTIRGFDSDGFLSFTVHQNYNAARDEIFIYSRGWRRNLRRCQKLRSGAEVSWKYGCPMTGRSTFMGSRFFEVLGKGSEAAWNHWKTLETMHLHQLMSPPPLWHAQFRNGSTLGDVDEDKEIPVGYHFTFILPRNPRKFYRRLLGYWLVADMETTLSPGVDDNDKVSLGILSPTYMPYFQYGRCAANNLGLHLFEPSGPLNT
ncbi:hypothetical protein Hypma_014058 [Hypsizygus marmoreus]|uniref:Uncharacterized protein n=1 Tax=Hypsizygus marmoreus TaxID=39966 RepID=A0A369KDW5_HYPMA|nr:hypothetical protein Hypma_014058 [Hypsizygus marmoreus]